MLIASTIAGMCFINTMTGGVHALAHSLGGRYGIPHGLANTIMLPEVMAFNLSENPERFMLVADALGLEFDSRDPLDAGLMAIQAVRDLRKEVGLTQTLKDFGVPTDREALQPLIDLASADGQLPYNPRTMEDEDIYQLYVQAN